jgi:hypothetical protein
MANKICTVVPNICGSRARNVSHLKPIILRSIIDYWNISVPLVTRVFNLEWMSRWASAVYHNKLGGGKKRLWFQDSIGVFVWKGVRRMSVKVAGVEGDIRPKTVPGLTTDSTCSTFGFEWVISWRLQILTYRNVPEKRHGLLSATVRTVTLEDLEKTTKIARKAASSWPGFEPDTIPTSKEPDR